MSAPQDDLAYGEDHSRERGPGDQGDRGIIGDTFKYFKDRVKQGTQSSQPYGQQQTGPGGPPYQTGGQSGQQQYGGTAPYSGYQQQYGLGSYVGFHSLPCL